MPKLVLKKSNRAIILKKKAEEKPQLKLKRGPYAPNPRITG